MVAWMIHSSKEAFNHQQLAEFMKERIGEETKRLQSIIVDGETALNCYSQILSVKQLRCQLHLCDNLKMKFGVDRGDQINKMLIGRKDSLNQWKEGILNSCSKREILKKVEFLHQKGYLTSDEKKWLDKHAKMLFDECSLIAKLSTGSVNMWNTTNVIEERNRDFKRCITRPQTHAQLAQSLLNFSNNAVISLYASLRSNGGKIEYVRFVNGLRTFEEMKKEAEAVGIKGLQCLMWKWPLSFWSRLDMIRLAEAEKQSTVIVVSKVRNGAFFTESSDATGPQFVNVVAEGNNSALKCSKCSNYLPTFICPHIIAVMNSLPSGERYTELTKLELDGTEYETERRAAKNTSHIGGGSKKVLRKGNESSHQNNIRTTTRVLDNSLFDDFELSEGDGGDESDNSQVESDSEQINYSDVVIDDNDADSVINVEYTADNYDRENFKNKFSRIKEVVSDSLLNHNLQLLDKNNIVYDKSNYCQIIEIITTLFIAGIQRCEKCDNDDVEILRIQCPCGSTTFRRLKLVSDDYPNKASIDNILNSGFVDEEIPVEPEGISTNSRRFSRRLSNPDRSRKRRYSPP